MRINALQQASTELQMFLEICPGSLEMLTTVQSLLDQLGKARWRLTSVFQRLQTINERMQRVSLS